MQPCSREMQALNSLLNQTQMSLQDLQNHHHQQIDPSQIHHQFDPPATSHDDFLDQMLSSLPSSSWPDLAAGGIPKSPWDLSSNPMLAAAIGLNKSRGATADDHDNVSQHQPHFDHDQSAMLAAKLRQHQIGGGGADSAVKNLLMQQQMMLQSRGFGGGGGLPSPNGGSGDSGLLPMPLSLGGGGDDVDVSSFKSPSPGDGSVQALFGGFSGSLHQTPNPHFQQNYGGAPGPATTQAPAASGSTGGASAQPRQRVRARRGQATDPHSIAERLRRERIAERMKALQELVPNANKTDKASMLDEIIDYVKFLQLQVKVLSMSRLGGASAVAPLVADMSSEGGRRGRNGAQTASTSNANDTMTVTEHQVAKLMEEDMGTAMQYLQGKGLCLMPISLATAISTATCRNPMASAAAAAANNPLLGGGENGGGPNSPSLSALTVQSATMGNGGTEIPGKDATSVSDP